MNEQKIVALFAALITIGFIAYGIMGEQHSYFIHDQESYQNYHPQNNQKSPNSYYSQITPNSASFRRDLQRLISRHRVLSYNEVWDAFHQTDTNGKCGNLIEDIYSSKCWSPGRRNMGGEQCHRHFKREGDCYNREHSWPKSWWGSSNRVPAFTDLHHLFPVDAFVNRKRGNLPLGEVIHTEFTSRNGAKIGKCKYFRGKCFEPADQYKGDLARVYFYMELRYEKVFTCCDHKGVKNSRIKEWMRKTLKKWHQNDIVSDKEKKRNEIIYSIQGNRNPFVDNPNWIQ